MTDDASTNTTTTDTTTSQPLTPARAAARKKPSDRKPKKTTQVAQKPPTAPRAEVDMSVSRDTVDVGIDFRPIPVRFGPGDEHLWHFTPDPEVDQWAAVEASVTAWQGRKSEEITMADAADLVEQVRAALAGMLANDGDQEAFMAERRYGPMTLVRVAQKIMEEVTGFPT